MPARVFFVAGTDTGVGKTVVAAGLLRAGVRAGLRCLAVKPVAAGCVAFSEGGDTARLVNEDAMILRRESNVALAYEELNPVALELPIAPHIAAARDGRDLSVAALASHCRGLAERDADWLVVEGAGGWLVPLNARETLADLCVALEAELILVVGMRLGCLNHALLTSADAQRRGVRSTGWVANCVEPEMPELQANLETLDARLPGPRLALVPHGAEASTDALVESVAAGLVLESFA